MKKIYLPLKKYFKRLETRRIYFFATIIYAIPLLCLGLFILDQYLWDKTEMLFWVLFLVGMVPCGLLGLPLSILGLLQSLKTNSLTNKTLGVIGVIAGLICLIGGILGIMLIYVVVS